MFCSEISEIEEFRQEKGHSLYVI